MEESLQHHTPTSRHRSKLEAQVASLAGTAESVNRNATQIEEQLFAAVQTALSDLQKITQGKLQQLLSCEMEVRRQLIEMDAVEALLTEQRKAMEPVEFCAAWTRHQQLRDQIQRIPIPQTDDSIERPITVEGRIRPICSPPPSQPSPRPRSYNATSHPDPTPHPSTLNLSLIHISEPTRLLSISYAVFCLKKKNNTTIKPYAN
eukprot:TRINITY_DN16853_c0_g2_i1.p1 TRINITY_DN16853_c0_g2~~TRINITY_DN16853_c0_g2_i1.p1  ORF type:complete len:204 (+),score=61.75 TRINITY_DN16853_c0_g2_i1:1-612(+)